jgi:drug/metabolite transporter (DMT)-like permease
MLNSRRLAILSFVVLVLFWGSSFPVIKVGLHYSTPLIFASLRTLLGGLIMALIALKWGGRLDIRRTWPMIVISSLLSVSFFFGFQTSAIYYLPSGLAAVLVYLQPILVSVFAWLWLNEQLSFFKIAGLLLGFSGVVAVSMESLFGKMSFIGILLAVSSAFSWALSVIYYKRIEKKVPQLWLIAGQFIVGGLTLLPVGMALESGAVIAWSGSFWFSLIYSSLFGISLAWLLYFRLLNMGEISRVSSFMFLVPLTAVVMGVLFLREAVSPLLLLGAFLIVLGIYLVNRRTFISENIQQMHMK